MYRIYYSDAEQKYIAIKSESLKACISKRIKNDTLNYRTGDLIDQLDDLVYGGGEVVLLVKSIESYAERFEILEPIEVRNESGDYVATFISNEAQ
jgi:hypothetical protein